LADPSRNNPHVNGSFSPSLRVAWAPLPGPTFFAHPCCAGCPTVQSRRQYHNDCSIKPHTTGAASTIPKPPPEPSRCRQCTAYVDLASAPNEPGGCVTGLSLRGPGDNSTARVPGCGITNPNLNVTSSRSPRIWNSDASVALRRQSPRGKLRRSRRVASNHLPNLS
jgi:hypothetical protein